MSNSMLNHNDDVVMSSMEDSHLGGRMTSSAMAVEMSEECPRSDDEFASDRPSTSGFKPYVNPNPTIEPLLQEMLLSSPSHLFSAGLLPADSLASTWEQWLCLLASSLTPLQWQGYWAAHAAIFGVQSVPIHLLSFFTQTQMVDASKNCRHTQYS